MTIKEKILLFIEEQNIKKQALCKQAGIAKSNMARSGLHSELGGDKIVKILNAYPELSAEWLMRGEGKMLRNENERDKIEYENEILTSIKSLEKRFEEMSSQLSDLKKADAHQAEDVECAVAG